MRAELHIPAGGKPQALYGSLNQDVLQKAGRAMQQTVTPIRYV